MNSYIITRPQKSSKFIANLTLSEWMNPSNYFEINLRYYIISSIIQYVSLK